MVCAFFSLKGHSNPINIEFQNMNSAPKYSILLLLLLLKDNILLKFSIAPSPLRPTSLLGSDGTEAPLASSCCNEGQPSS